MQRNAKLRLLLVAVAVGFGVAACEQGSPTDPSATEGLTVEGIGNPLAALGSTPYPGTKTAGKVKVCKDAGSPAGTYSFTVDASPVQAGDLVADSVSLTPGTCSIVWERLTASGPGADVTVTEVIPADASYQLDHITAVDDLNGTRDVSGPSVTLRVNGSHGAVATYYNEPKPIAHQVVLCKDASSPAGTFNFNITAAGTIGTDVVQATANLTAGSCDTVFVRVEAGPTAATITIEEVLAANGTVYLKEVKVDGTAAATVGGSVVVQQNVGPDKVVVFFNAAATVGASVAYHPTSQTPGVVHLCKTSNSPPGTYNFTVNGVGTVATDQIASNVSLTAGTCKVIFIRTVPQTVSATLTVTETIAGGATFEVEKIGVVNSSGTAFSSGSAAIIVTEDASPTGGSLIAFFNKTISVP